MGEHTILYNQLVALLRGESIPKPDGIPPKPTANFITMAVAGMYGWALRHGTPHQLAAARSLVVWMYDIQRANGHQALGPTPHLIEQLCPDPHAAFHLVSHVAIRLFSLGDGGAGAADVRSANVEWLAGMVALLRELSAPDGTVAAPCVRAEGDPAFGWYSAFLRMVDGLPLLPQYPFKRGVLADPARWDVLHPYMHVFRVLAYLEGGVPPEWLDRQWEVPQGLRTGAKPRPDLRVPHLAIPVTRGLDTGSGWVAWMDRKRGAGGLLLPVDWIVVNPSGDITSYGRNWETEPPAGGGGSPSSPELQVLGLAPAAEPPAPWRDAALWNEI
jgi:hypothetical protein